MVIAVTTELISLESHRIGPGAEKAGVLELDVTSAVSTLKGEDLNGLKM